MNDNSILPYLLISSLIIFLAGCSVFKGDSKDLYKELGIQYVTLKAIEDSDDPQARASRIVDIGTEAALLLDDGLEMTAQSIERYIRDSIRWETIGDSDVMLVNALITAVRIEIEARLSTVDVDKNKLLSVRKVFQIIVDTAASKI